MSTSPGTIDTLEEYFPELLWGYQSVVHMLAPGLRVVNDTILKLELFKCRPICSDEWALVTDILPWWFSASFHPHVNLLEIYIICCHSASCSGVHDCNHVPSSWGVSLLVTEHSLCPGHPWGGSLFFTSCRSQYLHSVQGLLDRPSAFPCCLPGRCWISKSRTNRSSNHLAIWSSGFLKLSSQRNDPWSVRITKCRP